MSKPLESTFELDTPLPTTEDLVRIIGDCDFNYFMSNYQQIVDKRRRLVPMTLNPFQKRVFEKLLPMVDPKTRLDRSKTILYLKGRRVGATTGTIAFINFILSYVEGIENLNVLHLFPTRDTASKLYTTKVRDIVTGVIPSIMPTIYKESSSSSVVLNYDSILGVRRHNFYELASAGANSLRGSDFHISILDECASYRSPEDVEAVVAPMMPPHGFSLTIFASTFDDKMGPWFKDKIVTALQHPDEYEVIFVPFWWSYPEEPYGCKLEEVELTDYDKNVLVPAMIKDGFPKERFADSIEWYHRMSATMSVTNMHKEFPSTIEEILAIGANKTVFDQKSVDNQKKNIIPDRKYRLVTDTITKKSQLQEDEDGDFCIYRPPMAGHRYMLLCDPIGSNSDESDYYAASVVDLDRNEQVATLYVRGLPVEDLSDLTVGLASIYNRAIICPERNMSQALVACIRAKGYYNFYYPDQQSKKNREPGIRTTVASKPAMIDKLQLMLNNESIIIHSKETLRQLRLYEKQKRKSGTTFFAAPKGDHDDAIIPLMLYAGTKTDRELMGKNTSGFAVMW